MCRFFMIEEYRARIEAFISNAEKELCSVIESTLKCFVNGEFSSP